MEKLKEKIRELEKELEKEIEEENIEKINEIKDNIVTLIKLQKRIDEQKDYKNRKKDIAERNFIVNELISNLTFLIKQIYEHNLYNNCKLNNNELIFYDLKTEKYLIYYKNSLQETTEFKSNSKTIEKLVEEDLKNTTNILVNFFLKNLDNKIIKQKIKNELRDSVKTRDIIKKIRGIRSFYAPFKEQGLIKIDNKYYYNLCFLPKYEKTAEKRIDEVYNNLKEKYKYVYLLLQNLFVTEENIKYILNYYSYILKTYKKLPYAIVLFGLQGSGKNVFADFFLSKIFKRQNIIIASNGELQSDFNGYLINKLFVAFNEVAGDITKNNKINNIIKQIVTDNKILINEKNISRFEIDNIFNTIFFSNSSEPIKIEAGDRRFIVFKTKNKKLLEVLEENDIEQFKYFEELDKQAEEFIKNELAKMKTKRPYHLKTKEWFNIVLKTNKRQELFKYFFLTSFKNLKEFLLKKNENEEISDEEIEKFVDKIEKQKMLSAENFEVVCDILYCKKEEDDNRKQHLKNLKSEFENEIRIKTKKYRTAFSNKELLTFEEIIIDNIVYKIKEKGESIIFKQIDKIDKKDIKDEGIEELELDEIDEETDRIFQEILNDDECPF